MKDVVPTTSWFYNAWVKEEMQRKRYMVGFIMSSIVNGILFWMVIK